MLSIGKLIPAKQFCLKITMETQLGHNTLMEQEEMERQRKYEEYNREIEEHEEYLEISHRGEIHHHESLELLAPDFEQDELFKFVNL